MEEFSYQGEVSTIGYSIYTSPNNISSKVKVMRFNNIAAYILTVEVFNYDLGILSTLYTLELSAGDTMTDTFEYTLNGKDYIKVTSNITGTIYSIMGEKYI